MIAAGTREQHSERPRRHHIALLLTLTTAACQREAREVGPSVAITPPRSADDARIPYYQENAYQVSQGGRYFAWYGCSGCHADDSPDNRNLTDHHWHRGEAFDAVYTTIAAGHGRLAYARRVPPEQLWQITAYVRDLPRHTPEKRRRLSVDQTGEPQGDGWAGPVR